MQSSLSAPASATASSPFESISLTGYRFHGDGASAVPLVWLYLISLAKTKAEVWPSNATISRSTGLSLRSVRYALAQLQAKGLVNSRWGRRRSWTKCGRILTLAIDGPVPRLRWPEPGEVRVVWSLCRGERERPIALATLALVLLVLSGGDRRRIHKITQVQLLGLTGSRAGGSFSKRIAELAELGVLERAGPRWSDGVRIGAGMFRVELMRSVADTRVELPPAKLLRCAPTLDYSDIEAEGHETMVQNWGPPRLASAG